MAASESSNNRNRASAFVSALVFGLPLLYLLSIGPVFFLLDKTNSFGGSVNWEWIVKFYWPVEWLYENTFMKQPIDLYLQLWGVK